MTIIRVEHKKNYTVVNNFICKDKRLSWKAKGIWLYAFSRPDDWEFHMADIINNATDGRDSVRGGLKELEECGYLQRQQKRADGKFSNVDWILYETPQELKKCLPKTENPLAANPVAANHPLLSTEEKLSTEETLNIEKKQQQQRAREADVAVVVSSQSEIEKRPEIYSCLTALEIPHKDKQEITQRYSEPVVKNAIEFTLENKSKIRTCLAAYLKMACQKELKITVAPAVEKKELEPEKAEENKQKARQFLSKNWSNESIRCGIQDFGDKLRLGNDYLYFKDIRFAELFEHFVRKIMR